MNALFDVILPVFLVVGFGYVVCWRQMLSEVAVDGIMGEGTRKAMQSAIGANPDRQAGPDTTRKLLRMQAPCGIDKGLHHADDDENGIILLLIGHSIDIGDKCTILVKLSKRNSNNLIHHNHHHDRARIPKQRESDFGL